MIHPPGTEGGAISPKHTIPQNWRVIGKGGVTVMSVQVVSDMLSQYKAGRDPVNYH